MTEQHGQKMAQTTTSSYPRFREAIPSVHEESGRYGLAFARSEQDLRTVQRLRFEVFNLEMGEGLTSSYAICRDEDSFDAACHHLMVHDMTSGEVVGTYRMQTQRMAAEPGFYSAAEFDLSQLAMDFLPNAVELGRACIALPHRNSRVLFLLWRGLAAYMLHNRKRYFFGCCSLTSQNPAEGLAMLQHLEQAGHMSHAWRVRPQPGFECEAPRGVGVGDVKMPRLMRTYLQYGASIAGPPAIDRQFKTIDFLAVFDLEAIDARIRRMFLT